MRNRPSNGIDRQLEVNISSLHKRISAGRRVGHVNGLALRRAAGSREVELPRADLAAILLEAGKGSAEIAFCDTVTALHQDEDGVDVTFQYASPRRFGLVIGADGLHSTMRRLVFGPSRRS